MAIKTAAERLEETQDAITKVLAGQEVELNGQRLRRADLDMLQKMEEYWLSRYQQEQTSSSTANRMTKVNVYRKSY